jgi:biotin synthase
MEKSYLIIAVNTGQMLLVEKIMRDGGITAEIVPAPPRPGMACTKAVKISGDNLVLAKQLIEVKRVRVDSILEDEGFKLQELLNRKLG